MSITHPLENLAQRIERALDAIDDPGLIHFFQENPNYSDIVVEESDDSFKVKLDLNDIDPDEVRFNASAGLLTLSSAEKGNSEPTRTQVEEFRDETDEANIDPEEMETYVPFTYQIAVPDNVDPSAIEVEFVEDTLEIQLAKTAVHS